MFDTYTAPLRGEDDGTFGRAWYFRDVTDDHRTRQALIETGNRFRTVARTLQESLLPPVPPSIPGVEVATRFHPVGHGVDVGGDFYDVFEIADNDHSVVIGDVCGKGVEAATLTALARYTIRASAMQARKPRVMLGLLNEAIIRQYPDGRYLTMIYVRLRSTPGGARATAACAGHPLPIVVRANGRIVHAGRPGTLLGVVHDIELSEKTVDLRATRSCSTPTASPNPEAPRGCSVSVASARRSPSTPESRPRTWRAVLTTSSSASLKAPPLVTTAPSSCSVSPPVADPRTKCGP